MSDPTSELTPISAATIHIRRLALDAKLIDSTRKIERLSRETREERVNFLVMSIERLELNAFHDSELITMDDEDASPSNAEIQDKNRPLFTTPAEFVTIAVSTGASKKEFIVHKNLLRYHSPFFKAAFTGNFKEGRTQAMTLEDVDSKVFGLLVHWMYTKEVYVREAGGEFCAAAHGTKVSYTTNIFPLADLWFLAERFLMPILQNNTIQKLCHILHHQNRIALLPLVRHIYDNDQIEAGHTLKNLTLKFLSEFANQESLASWHEKLPREAVWDLMLAYRNGYVNKGEYNTPRQIAQELYVDVE